MIQKLGDNKFMSVELTKRVIFNDVVPFVNVSFYVVKGAYALEYCVYDGNVYKWKRADATDKDKAKHYIFPHVHGALNYVSLESLNKGSKLFDAVMSNSIEVILNSLTEMLNADSETAQVAKPK